MKTKQDASAPANGAHTPGPWKILPDPIWTGKHPFHDSRHIATANAQVDYSNLDALSTDEHLRKQWVLESGSLICDLRDSPEHMQANARLIASAPDLLAALKRMLTANERYFVKDGTDDVAEVGKARNQAAAAIAKAEGKA